VARTLNHVARLLAQQRSNMRTLDGGAIAAIFSLKKIEVEKMEATNTRAEKNSKKRAGIRGLRSEGQVNNRHDYQDPVPVPATVAPRSIKIRSLLGTSG
jgi:hypothetical protein